jgi:hypothetical protein
MKNSNKQKIESILTPTAMMFLVFGLTIFNSVIWLKYSSRIISVILCVISIVLEWKKNYSNKE